MIPQIKPHQHKDHGVLDEQGNFTVAMHGSPALVFLILEGPAHTDGLTIEDIQAYTSYPKEAVAYALWLLVESDLIEPLTNERWIAGKYAHKYTRG